MSQGEECRKGRKGHLGVGRDLLYTGPGVGCGCFARNMKGIHSVVDSVFPIGTFLQVVVVACRSGHILGQRA